MIALDQPFAAISVVDLSGCNQVSNSNIDCSFVCCLADLFLVFFLDKSGLAHGDGFIDRMTRPWAVGGLNEWIGMGRGSGIWSGDKHCLLNAILNVVPSEGELILLIPTLK